MRKLLFIALKEFRLLARDRPALFMMIAVPIAVITVVGTALGGFYGRNSDFLKIRLPVVNQDKGEFSRSFIENLRESKSLQVEEVEYDQAVRLVRDTNEAAAAIVISKGFSTSYAGGTPFRIEVLTDPAKGLEVVSARELVNAAAMRLLLKMIPPPLGKVHVEITEQNLTGIKGNIGSFDQNVPGFSVMFIMFGLLIGFSEGIFRERDEDHTLKRLLIAPVSRSAILGGQFLARMTIGVFQMIVLFAFGYFAFAVSIGNSLFGLFLTIIGVSFSATSIGLLVSALSRSREQVRSLGTFVILTMASLGGCWWPLFIEPQWMQKLAFLAMPAWAMDCFFDLMLRGKTLAEILYPLAGLYLYGAVTLLLGLKLFRLRPADA
ncbi:MAG: hypothetical protein A3K18_06490 [Lentisphaerae bacterium RIFOXYA12_64_32]|nr:MAG: hypothetical protein A3K18_06490 [Lentisphaerae bacterium RIFOXYA12_64_32]